MNTHKYKGYTKRNIFTLEMRYQVGENKPGTPGGRGVLEKVQRTDDRKHYSVVSLKCQ